MNKEEKEAIDKIEKLIKYLRDWKKNFTIVPEDAKYFEKILEIIKQYTRMINEGIEERLECAKEIQKQDKIINDIKFLAYNNKPHITQEKIIEYFKKVVDEDVKN